MSWTDDDDDIDYDNPDFSHTTDTLSEIDELLNGSFVAPDIYVTAQRGERVTLDRYDDKD